MERALEGVSAAPGVAIGPAVILDHWRNEATRRLPADQRRGEAERARSALHAAAGELEAIAAQLRAEGRSGDADIVDTGVLMAKDPGLTQRLDLLVESGMAATDALRRAAEEVALELESLSDSTLAQRADDVRSVGRRASARAAGISATQSNGIVVARSLGPADVAELTAHILGIALARGGITSHAAIVARSLGIPMVIGLGERLLEIEDGEELVVDGEHGVVVRSPNAARSESVHRQADTRRAAREIAIARRTEPATTRDGRRIRVLANASTVAELDEALGQGAEGVGLMRTELLFLDSPRWPSFEQQVRVMRPVLARLEDQVATVRLFDFGGDKTPPFLHGVVARGIEILLGAPDVLRMHLRAVIDAGRGARLRLLVPMVTTAEQVRAVRNMVDAQVQIGAMIETPEAASEASKIARESDFLSLGTNDLTQLVLGLDREQSRKAPVMDVRVLRPIAETMRAARRSGIDVDVCGEAASDPKSLPVMIGLGADELSVAPARVGLVRQWIRELDYAEAQRKSLSLLDEA